VNRDSCSDFGGPSETAITAADFCCFPLVKAPRFGIFGVFTVASPPPKETFLFYSAVLAKATVASIRADTSFLKQGIFCCLPLQILCFFLFFTSPHHAKGFLGGISCFPFKKSQGKPYVPQKPIRPTKPFPIFPLLSFPFFSAFSR